jgi:hypothetical protein
MIDTSTLQGVLALLSLLLLGFVWGFVVGSWWERG